MEFRHDRPISLRAIQAAERREQREAKKRLRELERRAKEQAKLSQLEQARLEVESYENRLEVILSIHKEKGEDWDWSAIAALLPPPCPSKLPFNELRARQRLAVAFEPKERASIEEEVKNAQLLDENEFEKAMASYSSSMESWEKIHTIARRILAEDHSVYPKALLFLPLAEISELGSHFEFTSHSSKLLECTLRVNGTDAIPNEVKTLTSTGKVSVKTMPKARFHEIYQDYVCGCMLRVAREVFAFLPVDTLLLTASAELFDSSSGRTECQPVVSCVMHREVFAELDFDRLDPSDAIDSFQHRGDFKATRKSGAFLAIVPLAICEIVKEASGALNVDELVTRIRTLRMEVAEECEELGIRKESAAQ